MTHRHGSAKVTTPSEREIVITRAFDAPLAVVWNAMTTPRHVLRWWGPAWSPLVSCEIDLRVGGTWRYLAHDGDGNELGCLLPVEVAVPVATYTGWNPRKADVGAEGQLVSLTGSYIPFPVTKADRERTGDPRPSVQERYGSLDEYVHQLTAAADTLKASGYLLDEDAARLVKLHRERVAMLFTPAEK